MTYILIATLFTFIVRFLIQEKLYYYCPVNNPITHLKLRSVIQYDVSPFGYLEVAKQKRCNHW